MGKLILISGPNNSGKSRFAECLICAAAGEERCYLATMIPKTEDNRARIEKHRRQRAGLCFRTLETPYRVGDTAVPPEASVLVEDVSNLLGNAMFERGGDADSVFDDIRMLREKCAMLVAVTISGLSPEGYEGETAAYINALNRLNARLFDAADLAAEMRQSKPYLTKGEPDETLERVFGCAFDLQRDSDAAL